MSKKARWGIASVRYGVIADRGNQTIGVLASAATAALIVPLVLALRRYLRHSNSDNAQDPIGCSTGFWGGTAIMAP